MMSWEGWNLPNSTVERMAYTVIMVWRSYLKLQCRTSLSMEQYYRILTVIHSALIYLGSIKNEGCQGSKSGGSEAPGATKIRVGQLITSWAGSVGTPTNLGRCVISLMLTILSTTPLCLCLSVCLSLSLSLSLSLIKTVSWAKRMEWLVTF